MYTSQNLLNEYLLSAKLHTNALMDEKYRVRVNQIMNYAVGIFWSKTAVGVRSRHPNPTWSVRFVYHVFWVHRAFQILLQFLDPKWYHQMLLNLFWGGQPFIYSYLYSKKVRNALLLLNGRWNADIYMYWVFQFPLDMILYIGNYDNCYNQTTRNWKLRLWLMSWETQSATKITLSIGMIQHDDSRYPNIQHFIHVHIHVSIYWRIAKMKP